MSSGSIGFSDDEIVLVSLPLVRQVIGKDAEIAQSQRGAVGVARKRVFDPAESADRRIFQAQSVIQEKRRRRRAPAGDLFFFFSSRSLGFAPPISRSLLGTVSSSRCYPVHR